MNLLHANDRAGEYPASWYAATATALPPFPPLRGAARADVCVVGGGYLGLSAALHLAQRGYDVMLLEAQRVGFGASGRNGGLVGSGQRREQDVLEARHGVALARKLWDFAEEAKALVQSLIAGHGIDADYRPGVAHACRQQSEVDHAHRMADHMAAAYGYDRIEKLDRAATRALIGSPRFEGAVIDHGAGHLHPLRFALGLAAAADRAGVRIHERAEVHGIDRGAKPVVRTDAGEVRCDHVILAGNGYLAGLAPDYAARVMPINNFIVATEPLGARAKEVLAGPVAVEDSKFVVNYWRLSSEGRLLFGGGESYGWRFPDLRKTVRKPMLEVYPQLADVRLDYAWGGTLAITMTRMPCYLRLAPNILAASSCSGHGVALATMAGRVLAEAVAGQSERFDVMAAIPPPRFPGGVALRWPLLVLAMTWFAMRDRLGL